MRILGQFVIGLVLVIIGFWMANSLVSPFAREIGGSVKGYHDTFLMMWGGFVIILFMYMYPPDQEPL